MNEAWAQVISMLVGFFAIFFGNIGVIWWFRKESRDDWIRCENTINAIQEEMKDFHKRLLEIELKRK